MLLEEFQRRALVSEIAERVVALIAPPPPPPARPVYNLRESALYVGKKSVKALDTWARQFNVPRCGSGRFARRQLELGLEREARATYQHGKGLVA